METSLGEETDFKPHPTILKVCINAAGDNLWVQIPTEAPTLELNVRLNKVSTTLGHLLFGCGVEGHMTEWMPQVFRVANLSSRHKPAVKFELTCFIFGGMAYSNSTVKCLVMELRRGGSVFTPFLLENLPLLSFLFPSFFFLLRLIYIDLPLHHFSSFPYLAFIHPISPASLWFYPIRLKFYNAKDISIPSRLGYLFI